MATHSSILDWRILWTEKLRGLWSVELQRVGHSWSDLEHTHMPTELVMPPKYLILCQPFLLLALIFSRNRVLSNESALCIRWPKYWSFSLSISHSNEYLGLISFRIDWLDLRAIQGILKSLLQHHKLKASFLSCSAFFRVQHSHLYMTTGKTITLARWTFAGKVVSLLFNMLGRFVIVFLPRCKHLLILWQHTG